MDFILNKRPCWLCGSDREPRALFKQRFERLDKDYFIAECSDCGLIQQNPIWNEEFYNGLYSDLIYDPTGHKFYPDQTERYRKVAEAVGDLVVVSSRVLDFGCYDGSFVEWVKKFTKWGKQVELLGYDIALKNISAGNSFYNDLDRLMAQEQKFDVITLNHVLEHVFNPAQLINFIKNNLLKEGGSLVVEVPDISFIREDDFSPFHIQHISYFTPQAVVRLGRKLGLSLASIKTFKNFDINRDPDSPTLLAVFRKDSAYLDGGNSLQSKVALHRDNLKRKITSLGSGISLGLVGCGDPLFRVKELMGEEIKIGGLFDNNKKLWDANLLGYKIQPVEKVKESNCDAFLICTLSPHNTERILQQLRQCGLNKKIITVLDMPDLSDPVEQFKEEKKQRIVELGRDEEIKELATEFTKQAAVKKYAYNFTWLGRPIIQFPQDMVAVQELIWRIKPDLIIETGIAHGGSLILSASMLELVGGDGLVVGVDIDIRKHNRDLIEQHPLFKRIKMLEGSSIDEVIINQIKTISADKKRVMIFLDSSHTHDHVLRELQLYSPVVSVGNYLIVFDTMTEHLPKKAYSNRPWGRGNNPQTAVNQFLRENDSFVVDEEFENKLLISSNRPRGYLRKIK